MKLDFQTDRGIGTKANIGVIVLEADETLEHEFGQMIPNDGVGLYVSRIPMAHQVTADTLARMEAEIPASAQLLPAAMSFDAVGFGCTSAATVIGAANVAKAVNSVCAGAQVSDPLTAIIAALDTVGAKRIGFVTPYVADVSAQMRRKLEQAGFAIASFGSFEESDDRVVARITPASILAAIKQVAMQAPCDAVVVSCTNLRSLGVVAEAEKAIGCPVITSNQALAWHLLCLARVDVARPNLGQLFAAPFVGAVDERL